MWRKGGGIHVYLTNARIMENKILNNLSRHITMDGWCAGGGLFCAGDDFPSILAAISDNEISGNQALAPGGSYGGGASLLHLDNSSYFRDNVISGNKANWFGGGLDFFSYNPTTFHVESNYFFNNEAYDGGAIDDNYDSTSRILLTNNIFTHNTAYDQGGAIWTYRISGGTEDHLLVSVNNSFYDNHAVSSGGAVYSYEDNPMILNSIFWNNTDIDGNVIVAVNGTTETAYTDLDTNAIGGTRVIGAGMINADPLFQDTVLLITAPYSLCVDAGTESYTCSHGELYDAPDYDITGVPRPAGNGYDMGAYDLQYSGVGVPVVPAGLLLSARPNPFTSSIILSYTLKESSLVNLRVYDNFGRMVVEPVNAFQQTGQHHLELNTEVLAAGIYYCRLQAGDQLLTNKIIKK
jgi:hypothetical protein